MNIQQWLTPLLKIGRRKRSTGKGMIWASIISVIVSVIALSRLKRENGVNQPHTQKNIVPDKSKYDIQNFLTMNDRAVLAEFSKELTPKQNHFLEPPIETKEENNTHNESL